MVGSKTAGSNSVEKKKDFLRKYLEEKRCAMTRELVDALGIDRSTLLDLLRMLEREGAVQRHRVGRVVLWCRRP
jgi:DNA-binding IclR family transcriptional regulator